MTALHRQHQLFSFHHWRVYQLTAGLPAMPQEVLERPMPVATLGKLYAHVAGAETIWFERIQRALSGAAPQAVGFPTPPTEGPALAKAWRDSADRWLTWLEGIQESQLETSCAYLNLSGERFTTRLEDILTHILNHATYHAGQITQLHRALGLEVVNTDFIAYVRLQK